MARAVRGTFDFVRYLQPRFADAPALRARMKTEGAAIVDGMAGSDSLA